LAKHIETDQVILPVKEHLYLDYLAIYQEVVFNGAYSEALFEKSEKLIQHQPSFIAAYHLAMDIAEKLYVEKTDDTILKRLDISLAYMPTYYKDNTAFLTHRFHLYLNTEQITKAKQQLVQLSRRDLTEAEYKPLEASYFLTTNQYEQAIHAYHQAIKLRPSKVLYRNLAIAYWWNNDIALAIEQLSHVLSLSPQNYEANQLIATMYLSQGNTTKAIAAYEKLMTLNPSSMEMSNLALAYMLEGNYDKSYHYAKQAVDKSPRNPIWTLNLADVQNLRNNRAQAIKLYEQVIDNYQGQTDLTAWLSTSQALAHQGKYSEAIKAIDNARKLSPNNVEVAYISSIVLTIAGQDFSAINQANEALNNGMGPIWYKLPWFDKLCRYQEFKQLFSEYPELERC
jgi:serine/threonine-protein kinase